MEEAYKPRINFFQQRNFGEKVNITFDFLKENFKPLFKIILLVEAPLILIISVFYTFFFMNMMGMSGAMAAGEVSPMEMNNQMNSFFSSYSIIMVLGVVAVSTFFAILIRYMKLYQTQPPSTITIKSVLPTLFKDSAMLFGAYILYIITVILGMMFFFFPGIYLAIAFSMVFTIVIFEEENVFNGLSRSISLIRGKWWSTFGLLFIIGIIQGVIAMMFYIPFYSLMFTQMMFSLEGNEVFDRPSDFMIVLQSILMAVAYAGVFFTYSIGAIAISFQYFNLREKHESVGLISDIDNLGDEQ